MESGRQVVDRWGLVDGILVYDGLLVDGILVCDGLLVGGILVNDDGETVWLIVKLQTR